jgi:hypothetical protein
VARKADGASFDTAIWAVGCAAAGMEEANWRRSEMVCMSNLRKEGVAWLTKHARGDLSVARLYA